MSRQNYTVLLHKHSSLRTKSSSKRVSILSFSITQHKVKPTLFLVRHKVHPRKRGIKKRKQTGKRISLRNKHNGVSQYKKLDDMDEGGGAGYTAVSISTLRRAPESRREPTRTAHCNERGGGVDGGFWWVFCICIATGHEHGIIHKNVLCVDYIVGTYD